MQFRTIAPVFGYWSQGCSPFTFKARRGLLDSSSGNSAAFGCPFSLVDSCFAADRESFLSWVFISPGFSSLPSRRRRCGVSSHVLFSDGVRFRSGYEGFGRIQPIPAEIVHPSGRTSEFPRAEEQAFLSLESAGPLELFVLVSS